MDSVVLNAAQFAALQAWFDADNDEGEPLDPPDGSGVTIAVDRGQLCLNDCWLHTDGEWATYQANPATDELEPVE